MIFGMLPPLLEEGVGGFVLGALDVDPGADDVLGGQLDGAAGEGIVAPGLEGVA